MVEPDELLARDLALDFPELQEAERAEALIATVTDFVAAIGHPELSTEVGVWRIVYLLSHEERKRIVERARP
jgi:hypothetical protein